VVINSYNFKLFDISVTKGAGIMVHTQKNKSLKSIGKLHPDEPKRRSFWILIISIVVTFTVFMYIRANCIIPGSDYGVDVYYHIKAGDMFGFFSTSKQFPWAEMSLWKTNFYDKELGFHAIIFLLRQFSTYIGVPLSAPFNFIDGFFVAAIIIVTSIGSWFYCRTSSLIIPPFLIFISPFFFEKLCMVRPQLISILLFTVVLLILMINSPKRACIINQQTNNKAQDQLFEVDKKNKSAFGSIKLKCVLLFLIGWLYSLCYSVPHIAIIPVFIYVAVSLVLDKKYRSLFLLLSVIIGIAVGLTLHPQFPNSYKLWYIQGYEVVKKILGLSSSQVGLGIGLGAPTAKSLFQNSLIYILLIVNFIYILMNKKTNKNVFFLFVLQLVMLLGFLFSKRCIEYAVPAGVICTAYIINNYNEKTSYSHFFKMLSSVKCLVFSGLIFLVIMSPLTRSFLHYRTNAVKVSPLYSFAAWADSNVKKGTYIGLLQWGDFPRLFYVAPQFKYSMALDPMFSYYAYPKRTEVIEQFRLGNKKVGPKALSKALGTDLVYCSKYDHMPVMYLVGLGAQVVYYDKQGCLLKL